MHFRPLPPSRAPNRRERVLRVKFATRCVRRRAPRGETDALDAPRAPRRSDGRPRFRTSGADYHTLRHSPNPPSGRRLGVVPHFEEFLLRGLELVDRAVPAVAGGPWRTSPLAPNAPARSTETQESSCADLRSLQESAARSPECPNGRNYVARSGCSARATRCSTIRISRRVPVSPFKSLPSARASFRRMTWRSPAARVGGRFWAGEPL